LRREPFRQLATETREIPQVVVLDTTSGPCRRPGRRRDDEADRDVAEWIGANLHPKFAAKRRSVACAVPRGTVPEGVEKLAQCQHLSPFDAVSRLNRIDIEPRVAVERFDPARCPKVISENLHAEVCERVTVWLLDVRERDRSSLRHVASRD
jgi:hypothetical protein